MKEFIKKRYNILIPAFLIIVILIAVLIYTREYKNNRYAESKDVNVYQYFYGNKMEYVAKIGRNKKKAILEFAPKNFEVSLDSTPVYVANDKNSSVIFPKEMIIFMPLKDKIYQVDALSELYIENDLTYLRLKRFNKTFDHIFLYDGRDLYFFAEATTIVIGDREIKLSPMSYVSCSYLNILEYYDKETSTNEVIDLNNENVYAKNDYMTIDITLDKVIYKDSFTLLGNNFSSYKKITDIEE